ncbi:polymorphic toxin-type HINT domain-containing protein [Streptosporangium lutulentum]
MEKVKLGDKVLATNPETGETAPEEVTALITGQGIKKLVHLTVDTDGEHGTATAAITATDGHPFWIPQLHQWLNAANYSRVCGSRPPPAPTFRSQRSGSGPRRNASTT